MSSIVVVAPTNSETASVRRHEGCSFSFTRAHHGSLHPNDASFVPGLISREAVSRAKELIREAVLSGLDDEVEFDKWFGAQVTRCSHRDPCGRLLPVVLFVRR